MDVLSPKRQEKIVQVSSLRGIKKRGLRKGEDLPSLSKKRKKKASEAKEGRKQVRARVALQRRGTAEISWVKSALSRPRLSVSRETPVPKKVCQGWKGKEIFISFGK